MPEKRKKTRAPARVRGAAKRAPKRALESAEPAEAAEPLEPAATAEPARRRRKLAPAEPARRRRKLAPADTLLTVDVGNSETTLGLFRGAALAGFWRLTTTPMTADEITLRLDGLMRS